MHRRGRIETFLGGHGFGLGATLSDITSLFEHRWDAFGQSRGVSNIIGMGFGSLKRLRLLPLLCRNDLRCSTEFTHWGDFVFA